MTGPGEPDARVRPGAATSVARGSTTRRSVEQWLADARRRIDRVRPEDLGREMAEGALVVDTRPLEERVRDGELPGAVVIDRNVLEWRLDPASEWCIPETQYDRRIIVVCTEGYSSSLVAAGLVDLGLHRAADLEDGFEAWAAHRSGDR